MNTFSPLSSIKEKQVAPGLTGATCSKITFCCCAVAFGNPRGNLQPLCHSGLDPESRNPVNPVKKFS